MSDDFSVTTTEKNRFSQFLCHLQNLGRSERTQIAYKSDWRNFCIWYFESTDTSFAVEQLRRQHLRAYLGWLGEQGLRQSTINRRLIHLKKYVKWCGCKGHIRTDIQSQIEAVVTDKPDTAPAQGLSEKAARQLLSATTRGSNAIRDRAIMMLMLHTGVGISELTALRLNDVDLHDGEILIRSKNKIRSVPLPESTVNAMTEYFAARPHDAGNSLFIGRQGKLTNEGVSAIIDRCARAAKLEGVTPMTLRHTFAYNYMEHSNNDVVGLAQILGFNDLNSTRIYLRRSLDRDTDSTANAN